MVIYREIFHLSSSWYFSSLVFSEPLDTFALLSSKLLFPKWDGRARFGFRFIYFFAPGSVALMFLQRGPGVPAAGLVRPGQRAGRGVQGRGLSAGRGLPAERGGRAHPRLAASSSAGGDGGGGRSRMLVSSLQLQTYSSS